MQNSEKKIDGIFRDKLQAHEVTPPPAVWDNIVNSLDGKNRKRRMIWILGLSSAASLLFAFLAGWYISGQTSSSPIGMQAENSISVPQSPSQVEPAKQAVGNLTASNEKTNTLTTSKKSNTLTNKTPQTIAITRTEQLKSEDAPSENFIFRLLSPKRPFAESNQNSSYALMAMNSDDFSEADMAIIARNMQLQQQETKANNKLKSGISVGIQGSPVYRFNNNSSMVVSDESQLGSSGSQEYVTNMAGGIAVTYKTNNRLSFQSGISYDEIAQQGGGIGVSFAGHNWVTNQSDNLVYAANPTNPTRNTTNNVVLKTDMGLTNIEMPAGAEVATVNSINKTSSEPTKNYDLKQQAGYLEIPLIVRYRIIDQRLGFHVLGGVNTNVLMTNNASLSDKNEVIANGKIEGLNQLTFSSSVGLGMNYAISERFNFSLEPTMKFQLNSLTSQDYINARPYTVGIFTGLTYNF